MDEIAIRRAVAADAAALAAVSTATFLDTFVDGFGIAYPAADLETFIAEKHSQAAYAKWLADDEIGVWVAEDAAGTLLGYAVAGSTELPIPEADPSEGELHRLYVVPAAKGAGLAGRLLTEVLTWLQADQRPVWLGVWSENLRAQRFYARHGFEKIAEFDYHVGQSVDREFAMRRAASAFS
jgi:diamine N-acetyltransferase